MVVRAGCDDLRSIYGWRGLYYRRHGVKEQIKLKLMVKCTVEDHFSRPSMCHY